MLDKSMCCECNKPATWIRHTQFSGSHPFCATHAQQEEGFGKSDSSDFFWENVSDSEAGQKKHPVEVAGFDGSFQELAEAIFQMRYDKVGEFLHYCAVELRRQAENDNEKGRHQLSDMLHVAANAEEHQKERFCKIYRLCQIHMTD